MYIYLAAYEILSNPKRRLAFDSVDPTVDDTVPSAVKDPSKFISVFRPVFQRNARFVDHFTLTHFFTSNRRFCLKFKLACVLQSRFVLCSDGRSINLYQILETRIQHLKKSTISIHFGKM